MRDDILLNMPGIRPFSSSRVVANGKPVNGQTIRHDLTEIDAISMLFTVLEMQVGSLSWRVLHRDFACLLFIKWFS